MLCTYTQIDAIKLLKADHRAVECLFDRYIDADTIDEKYELTRKICGALLIHMEIEEAIFYPAVHKVTGNDNLIAIAQSENAGARDIISKLGNLELRNIEFDTLVQQLKAEIEHHVDGEENGLFPYVCDSHLNAHLVGIEILELKSKLLKLRDMPMQARQYVYRAPAPNPTFR